MSSRRLSGRPSVRARMPASPRAVKVRGGGSARIIVLPASISTPRRAWSMFRPAPSAISRMVSPSLSLRHSTIFRSIQWDRPANAKMPSRILF